jgi:hypothetical protein
MKAYQRVWIYYVKRNYEHTEKEEMESCTYVLIHEAILEKKKKKKMHK